MSLMRSICEIAIVATLAVTASCAVSSDEPRDEPNAQMTTEDVTAAESQLAVPGGLQLIEPRATCKANGGVCTGLRLCEGSGHHTIAGSCPAGMVCCK